MAEAGDEEGGDADGGEAEEDTGVGEDTTEEIFNYSRKWVYQH